MQERAEAQTHATSLSITVKGNRHMLFDFHRSADLQRDVPILSGLGDNASLCSSTRSELMSLPSNEAYFEEIVALCMTALEDPSESDQTVLMSFYFLCDEIHIRSNVDVGLDKNSAICNMYSSCMLQLTAKLVHHDGIIQQVIDKLCGYKLDARFDLYSLVDYLVEEAAAAPQPKRAVLVPLVAAINNFAQIRFGNAIGENKTSNFVRLAHLKTLFGALDGLSDNVVATFLNLVPLVCNDDLSLAQVLVDVGVSALMQSIAVRFLAASPLLQMAFLACTSAAEMMPHLRRICIPDGTEFAALWDKCHAPDNLEPSVRAQLLARSYRPRSQVALLISGLDDAILQTPREGGGVQPQDVFAATLIRSAAPLMELGAGATAVAKCIPYVIAQLADPDDDVRAIYFSSLSMTSSTRLQPSGSALVAALRLRPFRTPAWECSRCAAVMRLSLWQLCGPVPEADILISLAASPAVGVAALRHLNAMASSKRRGEVPLHLQTVISSSNLFASGWMSPPPGASSFFEVSRLAAYANFTPDVFSSGKVCVDAMARLVDVADGDGPAAAFALQLLVAILQRRTDGHWHCLFEQSALVKKIVDVFLRRGSFGNESSIALISSSIIDFGASPLLDPSDRVAIIAKYLAQASSVYAVGLQSLTNERSVATIDPLLRSFVATILSAKNSPARMISSHLEALNCLIAADFAFDDPNALASFGRLAIRRVVTAAPDDGLALLRAMKAGLRSRSLRALGFDSKELEALLAAAEAMSPSFGNFALVSSILSTVVRCSNVFADKAALRRRVGALFLRLLGMNIPLKFDSELLSTDSAVLLEDLALPDRTAAIGAAVASLSANTFLQVASGILKIFPPSERNESALKPVGAALRRLLQATDAATLDIAISIALALVAGKDVSKAYLGLNAAEIVAALRRGLQLPDAAARLPFISAIYRFQSAELKKAIVGDSKILDVILRGLAPSNLANSIALSVAALRDVSRELEDLPRDVAEGIRAALLKLFTAESGVKGLLHSAVANGVRLTLRLTQLFAPDEVPSVCARLVAVVLEDTTPQFGLTMIKEFAQSQKLGISPSLFKLDGAIKSLEERFGLVCAAEAVRECANEGVDGLFEVSAGVAQRLFAALVGGGLWLSFAAANLLQPLLTSNSLGRLLKDPIFDGLDLFDAIIATMAKKAPPHPGVLASVSLVVALMNSKNAAGASLEGNLSSSFASIVAAVTPHMAALSKTSSGLEFLGEVCVILQLKTNSFAFEFADAYAQLCVGADGLFVFLALLRNLKPQLTSNSNFEFLKKADKFVSAVLNAVTHPNHATASGIVPYAMAWARNVIKPEAVKSTLDACQVIVQTARLPVELILDAIGSREDDAKFVGGLFPAHPLFAALLDGICNLKDSASAKLRQLKQLAAMLPPDSPVDVTAVRGQIFLQGLAGSASNRIYGDLLQCVNSSADLVKMKGQLALFEKISEICLRKVDNFDEGSCKIARAGAVAIVAHVHGGFVPRECAEAGAIALLSFLDCSNLKKVRIAKDLVRMVNERSLECLTFLSGVRTAQGVNFFAVVTKLLQSKDSSLRKEAATLQDSIFKHYSITEAYAKQPGVTRVLVTLLQEDPFYFMFDIVGLVKYRVPRDALIAQGLVGVLRELLQLKGRDHLLAQAAYCVFATCGGRQSLDQKMALDEAMAMILERLQKSEKSTTSLLDRISPFIVEACKNQKLLDLLVEKAADTAMRSLLLRAVAKWLISGDVVELLRPIGEKFVEAAKGCVDNDFATLHSVATVTTPTESAVFKSARAFFLAAGDKVVSGSEKEAVTAMDQLRNLAGMAVPIERLNDFFMAPRFIPKVVSFVSPDASDGVLEASLRLLVAGCRASKEVAKATCDAKVCERSCELIRSSSASSSVRAVAVELLLTLSSYEQSLEGLRTADAAALLTPLLDEAEAIKLMNADSVSMVAVTIANISGGDQARAKSLNVGADIIAKVVRLLGDSVSKLDAGIISTAPIPLVSLCQALTALGTSDSGAKAILATDCVERIVQLLENDWEWPRAQDRGCRVLWTLAFDGGNGLEGRLAKCGGMEALKTLSETDSTKKNASGALWQLQPKTSTPKAALSPAPASESGCVSLMMSYSWAQQPLVVSVVKVLRDRGFKVWLDVDDMAGSTIEAMASAVEGAEHVLICMSPEYKSSANCRMEAEYALQCKKHIVPLLVSGGYRADGWLGLMMGAKLWYDMSDAARLTASVDALAKALGASAPAQSSSATLSKSVQETSKAPAGVQNGLKESTTVPNGATSGEKVQMTKELEDFLIRHDLESMVARFESEEIRTLRQFKRLTAGDVLALSDGKMGRRILIEEAMRALLRCCEDKDVYEGLRLELEAHKLEEEMLRSQGAIKRLRSTGDSSACNLL